MVGPAVRMEPGRIASVTAASLAALGLLCGGREPRPPSRPGQAPYDVLKSVC
jgi:hypothetical protein